jgi:hypothetical protein
MGAHNKIGLDEKGRYSLGAEEDGLEEDSSVGLEEDSSVDLEEGFSTPSQLTVKAMRDMNLLSLFENI